MKKSTYFISFIFLILVLISRSYGEEESKILVIHSYHQGLEWTDNITLGIQSAFSQNESIELHYEYLDMKRNYGNQYFEQLIELFRKKSKLIEYKAIIVADNAAYNFILDYGKELYGNTPIVFCGVNNFNPDTIKNHNNITGITESTDHYANIQLILDIHPKTETIRIVNDLTLTGQAIKSELLPVLNSFKDQVEFEFYEDFELDHIKQDFENFDPTIPIYLLVINRDSTDRFVSYNEGISILRQSTINPIYGAWDFYLDKGIVGGKITSGFEHGKTAASMVQLILEGQTAKSIPILDEQVNQYTFDANILEEYGIGQWQLPDGSVIVNPPPSNWEKFKLQFILLMSLMLVVIIWLIYDHVKGKWESLKLKTLILEKSNELELSEEELYRLTVTDKLTKVYNRNQILKQLEHEIETSRLTKVSVSLIRLDLDHFKTINDLYGHSAGDKVLAEVALVIQNQLDPQCHIGRYGGNEFIIVMPGYDQTQCYDFAESLRHSISALEFKTEVGIITMSSGVLEVHTKSPDDAVHNAGILLRKAKAEGRNRTCSNSDS